MSSCGRIGGDHFGQLDERHRIPGSLIKYLTAGAATGRAGLGVEQPGGRRIRQRPELQLGEAAVESARRRRAASTEQEHDLLRIEAGGSEGERVKGAAIKPVRVLDDQEQRGFLRHVRQQGKNGYPDQQPAGAGRRLDEAKRAEECAGLAVGEPVDAVE
jgi:hypothetical protein